MNRKKRYVFVTNGITEVGGLELYLVNKIQWLEKEGWEVHVFSSRFCFRPYKISELRKYKKENLPFLLFPPYAYTKKNIAAIIKKFKKRFDGLADETIVESHSGSTALWGELFAKELRARHHIAFLHEYFREECYSLSKVFFVYKLNRKEIFCEQNAKIELIQKILNEDPNKAIQNFVQYNPVLDIENHKLNKIRKKDYTICYIGRTDKPYFPSIVLGVSKFARKYKGCAIQFVVVGKRPKRAVIRCLTKLKNLRLVKLGETFPIPKKLYELVDCVCAGSGSARCSVMMGKPVIVPDPNTLLANGVLGYDTNESVASHDKTISVDFFNAFESTLIRKDYLLKEFSYPAPLSVDECCKRNMDIIHRVDFDYKYFRLEEMSDLPVRKKYRINAWIGLRFPALKLFLDAFFKFVKKGILLPRIKKERHNVSNESE